MNIKKHEIYYIIKYKRERREYNKRDVENS